MFNEFEFNEANFNEGSIQAQADTIIVSGGVTLQGLADTKIVAAQITSLQHLALNSKKLRGLKQL